MIRFREATSDDRAVLLHLMEAYYRYDGLDFDRSRASEAFQLLLEHPGFGQTWLIMDNESAAGYVVLTIGFSFEYHGFDSFLDELFVSEEYRGRGIGRKVIDFLIGECQKRHIKALHLEVEKRNKKAQEFYRKTGFQDHGRYLMTRLIAD